VKLKELMASAWGERKVPKEKVNADQYLRKET